jgi:hypothetical protein
MTKQMTYKMRDLPGTFYTRGKSRVIWYRYGRNYRISTGFPYTQSNKIKAKDYVLSISQEQEQQNIKVGEVFEEFILYKNWQPATKANYMTMFNNYLNPEISIFEEKLLRDLF